jgi:hypothetical protein
LRFSKGAVFDFEFRLNRVSLVVFHLILSISSPPTLKLSFREDVTKLQKGDFFASKLIVFSVTFGRKTKKSQPPTGESRPFLLLRSCETVGSRSGGISLRSIAQASPFLILASTLNHCYRTPKRVIPNPARSAGEESAVDYTIASMFSFNA